MGQELGSRLVRWLRVCQVQSSKSLPGPGGSVSWVAALHGCCWQRPSFRTMWAFVIGCFSVLVVWQLSFPRLCDPRESKEKATLSFVNCPKLHTFTSALFHSFIRILSLGHTREEGAISASLLEGKTIRDFGDYLKTTMRGLWALMDPPCSLTSAYMCSESLVTFPAVDPLSCLAFLSPPLQPCFFL